MMTKKKPTSELAKTRDMLETARQAWSHAERDNVQLRASLLAAKNEALEAQKVLRTYAELPEHRFRVAWGRVPALARAVVGARMVAAVTKDAAESNSTAALSRGFMASRAQQADAESAAAAVLATLLIDLVNESDKK